MVWKMRLFSPLLDEIIQFDDHISQTGWKTTTYSNLVPSFYLFFGGGEEKIKKIETWHWDDDVWNKFWNLESTYHQMIQVIHQIWGDRSTWPFHQNLCCQVLRVPPTWQHQIDLACLSIRSKAYSDQAAGDFFRHERKVPRANRSLGVEIWS